MTSQLFEQVRGEGRTLLTEIESKHVIEAADIPTTRTLLARCVDEAVASAREIGYPVVLKIVSPDIAHKSDIGGVELNLQSEPAVRSAYERILARLASALPDVRPSGVSIQPMARAGTEVIVGMTRDPQFGPVLMFGLGGVLVEVFKDVAFRLVPISRRDAREMLHEITAYPILAGYRGREPADMGALEDLLVAVSSLAEQHPEIEELDLNPVVAYRDSVLAVDARIVLASS